MTNWLNQVFYNRFTLNSKFIYKRTQQTKSTNISFSHVYSPYTSLHILINCWHCIQLQVNLYQTMNCLFHQRATIYCLDWRNFYVSPFQLEIVCYLYRFRVGYDWVRITNECQPHSWTSENVTILRYILVWIGLKTQIRFVLFRHLLANNNECKYNLILISGQCGFVYLFV